MSILGELQLAKGHAFVELYEIDATAQGGTVTRFHAGTNGLRQPVVWQGNTYEPFPIMATGFEASGQQMARPKLAVANVNGLISAMLMQADLLGANVIRRRTMVKYLDEVNFETRRNLLTYTESFGNAAWRKDNVTITEDAILSPDGTSTADLFTSGSTPDLYPGVIFSVTYDPATIYTASIYAKAGDTDFINLTFPPGAFGGDTGASFDVTAGTVVASDNCTATIQSASNGWYRCSITATSTAGGTYSYSYGFDDTTTGLSAYLWGAQLEVGTLSAYQPVRGATYSANPTADPNSHLPDDVWYISQKTTENAQVVEFELASPVDLEGVMIPGRQIQPNLCAWRYRGEGCGYAGGPVADANDNPTVILANDRCSKRLSGCKLRWGSNAELPFGGFPGAGLVRR